MELPLKAFCFQRAGGEPVAGFRRRSRARRLDDDCSFELPGALPQGAPP